MIVHFFIASVAFIAFIASVFFRCLPCLLGQLDEYAPLTTVLRS